MGGPRRRCGYLGMGGGWLDFQADFPSGAKAHLLSGSVFGAAEAEPFQSWKFAGGLAEGEPFQTPKVNAPELLRKALEGSTLSSGYKVSLERLKIHSVQVLGDAL